MSNLILHQRGDNFPSRERVAKELRRLFGSHGRCETWGERTVYGTIYMVFVVATTDGPIIVDHPDQDGKAQLEWWQQDHVLCGFGRSRKLGEAVDQAMAAARRGNLEQRGITLWLDRRAAKFIGYRRSPRGEGYRPTGERISPATFAELVS
jgi:hypothetical protein